MQTILLLLGVGLIAFFLVLLIKTVLFDVKPFFNENDEYDNL